jgi:hypothetical protein
METGLVVLGVALMCRSLVIGSGSSRDWATRAVLAVALLLMRLDTALALLALAGCHLAVVGLPRPQLRRAVGCFAAVVALVGSWMLWCKSYFGTYVPQSMLAKTGHSYATGGFAVDSLGFELAANVAKLLDLTYPWPVVIKPLATIVWPALVLGGLGLAIYLGRTDQKVRFLAAAASTHVVLYACFMTVGRADVFPWYAHLPVFLVWSAILAALAPHWRRRVPAMLLVCLLGGCLVQDAITWRGMIRQRRPSPLQRVGQQLAERECESVMLEPIGVIGFYSRCPQVYDLAGLVSPEVFAFRRQRTAGWFYRAVRHLQPEHVVLRAGEVAKNLGWNVGVLFANDAERRDFLRRYRKLRQVDPHYEVYAYRQPMPPGPHGEIIPPTGSEPSHP